MKKVTLLKAKAHFELKLRDMILYRQTGLHKYSLITIAYGTPIVVYFIGHTNHTFKRLINKSAKYCQWCIYFGCFTFKHQGKYQES